MTAACALPLLAACGNATPGEPVAATFHPCTDIPDSALVAAGVDPTTETTGIFGVQFPDWDNCTWVADWYSISAVGAKLSLDDVRNNPLNSEFRDIEINGRPALEHRRTDDSRRDSCYVAFAVETGVAMMRLGTEAGMAAEEEPCAALQRRVSALEPYVPR